jgi:nitronate monooxygenase
VPAVADLASPTPVLAAGGIADGRGMAAGLVLGAAGALIGTRFLATAESLADPAAKKAIIEGCGEDTERSSELDIARGSRWPRRYTARTLRLPGEPVWASQAIGRITDLPPAAGLVETLAAQAADALAGAGGHYRN